MTHMSKTSQLVSQNARLKISEAIKQAEQETSGEIVAVLTAQSGSYRLVPFLLAALAALMVPMLLIYFPLLSASDWPFWTPQKIYICQLLVFAFVSLIVMWPPLRYGLIPKTIKHKWSHAHAVEQFLAQQMHTTQNRTGVLIFVSVAEHYAEIIADEGIYSLAPKDIWQKIIDDMTKLIQAGDPEAGFLHAISETGAILKAHFPPEDFDPNELPDHLIVLE